MWTKIRNWHHSPPSCLQPRLLTYRDLLLRLAHPSLFSETGLRFLVGSVRTPPDLRFIACMLVCLFFLHFPKATSQGCGIQPVAAAMLIISSLSQVLCHDRKLTHRKCLHCFKAKGLDKINQVYYAHKENSSELNSGATKHPKLEQIERSSK